MFVSRIDGLGKNDEEFASGGTCALKMILLVEIGY